MERIIKFKNWAFGLALILAAGFIVFWMGPTLKSALLNWGVDGSKREVFFFAVLLIAISCISYVARAWRKNAPDAVRLIVACSSLGLLSICIWFNFHTLAEIYKINTYKISTGSSQSLTSLIVDMPDHYPGSGVFRWLNLNAAGATLVGERKALAKSGLAPHRLIGLTKTHVILANEHSISDIVSIDQDKFFQMDIGDRYNPILLPRAFIAAKPILCAVPTKNLLIIHEVSAIERCTST